MTDSPTPTPEEFPSAVAVPRKRGFSLVWLVPLVAVLVGIGLVVRTAMERGPEITVTFATADGIEPGKTKVRYKNVEIGVVEKVELARDLEKINVGIRMSKSAADLLVEDAHFWVERPRVSGTNIEGLGTLLSGAFIGMDIGKSSQRADHYTGLERPPQVAFTEPGSRFVLRARQLGSFDTGSQLYYRRVAVGQVVGFEMDKDGEGISVQVFIKAPYDRFVTADTRFWEASGVDFELNAGGIRVDTQSLNSLLAGGIAFENRPSLDGEASPPAGKDAVFKLYDRRTEAMALEDQEILKMRLAFNESVRGLTVGAPVDFRGLDVGRVTRISGDFDVARGVMLMVVDIDIYPERLRRVTVGKRKKFAAVEQGVDALVAGGMRAQLRTGNLISGQLMIALDFFKGTPKAKVDWQAQPPLLPTVPGALSRIEEQAGDLLKSASDLLAKLQALPLEQLTKDASGAVKSLDSALKRVDEQLADDSLLQHELRDALNELTRAASDARNLLEYQNRYPESLIWGKPKEE